MKLNPNREVAYRDEFYGFPEKEVRKLISHTEWLLKRAKRHLRELLRKKAKEKKK